MQPATLGERLRRFGFNSNSFLSLYPGFSYFESPRGVQPYVETPGAWIGAAEPISDAVDLPEVLRDFAEAAKAQGKRAISIPVRESVAREARRAGFGVIRIGSEPTFDLSMHDLALETVPTAKHLARRGYEVEEFRPAEVSASDRFELDRIKQEWLSSRKMVALSFLNTVDPWALSDDKKYFLLRTGGRPVCFLAAIPIWPRGGWYFIDLLRPHKSTPGSTELLILGSMRLLKKQGAKEVTLGVAPLSNLGNLDEDLLRDHGWLYPVLDFAYRRGNLFYNFRPLHQFKLKFKPTSEEPAYLIYSPSDWSIRVPVSLFQAFLPRGFVHATLSGIGRGYHRLRLAELLRTALKPGLVFRSIPNDPKLALRRCRVTSILIVANVAAFLISVNHSGKLAEPMSRRFAFSGSGLLGGELAPTIVAGFLHWDSWHLLSNLLLMCLGCGLLEIVVGSAEAAWIYAAGTLLSNPLTAFLILKPADALAERDVGASLGIFACLGALFCLMRQGVVSLAVVTVGVLFYARINASWISLNHLIALALGIAGASLWSRNK